MKLIDMAVHEVATITAAKTICDCARQMRLEHVGSLVVVNDDQTPLGMITDRDIAIEVVARNLDPMKLTVRDVMTTPVVTAGPAKAWSWHLPACVNSASAACPSLMRKASSSA